MQYHTENLGQESKTTTEAHLSMLNLSTTMAGAATKHRHVGIDDPEFTLYQFSGLLQSAAEKGKLSKELQHLVNKDKAPIERDTGTISYSAVRKILEHLWFPEDRTESIFTHANRIRPTSFGTVGLASTAMQTREERIRFCAKNFRTTWSSVAESNPDGTLSLYHLPRFYDPEMRSALELFHFINCVTVSRSHSPTEHIAQSVGFTAGCGVSAASLEKFFGCPVIIGVDVAYIQFRKDWMQRPLPPAPESNHATLRQLCHELHIAATKQGHTFFEVLTDYERAIHSLEQLANHYGVSRRTLARLFDKDGTSYSVLSREARLLHAKRLLKNATPINEIANSLGFSDERSFRRAFRTWTGMAPSEYRSLV